MLELGRHTVLCFNLVARNRALPISHFRTLLFVTLICNRHTTLSQLSTTQTKGITLPSVQVWLCFWSIFPEFNNFNLPGAEKGNYNKFLIFCKNSWLSPLIGLLSQHLFKAQGNQIFLSYQFNQFAQGRIWILSEFGYKRHLTLLTLTQFSNKKENFLPKQ